MEFKIITDGLIEGSKAHKKMFPYRVGPYKNKSKGHLLSADATQIEVWEISRLRNLSSNLQKFKIRPKY